MTIFEDRYVSESAVSSVWIAERCGRNRFRFSFADKFARISTPVISALSGGREMRYHDGFLHISIFLLTGFASSYRLHYPENSQQPIDNEVSNKSLGKFGEKFLSLNSASNRPLRDLLTIMQTVSTSAATPDDHAIRHGRHRGPGRHRHNSTVPLQSVNGSMAVSMVSLDSSHANCYTSNEVLEIILVTCLVNFTFWSLILACVHLHTKNQQFTKTDSYESLSPSDDGQISNSTSNPLRLNSMERFLESGDLSEDGQANHWQKSVRGRHLSQLLTDLISLDNLQIGRWQQSSSVRENKSLSMENLLF